MKWYLQVLKNYFDLDGRARRKEYWYFFLCHLTICVVLSVIDYGIDSNFTSINMGLLSVIYIVATVIPATSVVVRRLHDTGRSGWWYFLAVIPYVGLIALLIFLALDGQPGDNQYGPNPNEVIA